MDVYRFRSKARVVAIVDLILSSMSLCICLILLLGAFILSTAPVTTDEEADEMGIDDRKRVEQGRKMIMGLLWFLVIFTGLATIIQILAAIKLLNATQLGKDPVGALKLCIFWRRVCIVFTVLLLIGIIFNRIDNMSCFFTIIQVLLRVWAVYTVTQFMKELDAAIQTGVLPIHCQSGTTPIIAGVYAYIPPTQTQQQSQATQISEANAAPPSYYEVVKEPPPMKQ